METAAVNPKMLQSEEEPGSAGQLETGTTPEHSIFKIMVEKHREVEQSVSLLKDEVASHIAASVQAAEGAKRQESAKGVQVDFPDLTASQKPFVEQRNGQPQANNTRAKQFESLESLFSDSKVKQMVKTVGGEGAYKVLDETLDVMGASCSTAIKQQVLSKGIQRMQTRLKDLESLDKDPSVKLAFNFLGLSSKDLYKL